MKKPTFSEAVIQYQKKKRAKRLWGYAAALFNLCVVVVSASAVYSIHVKSVATQKMAEAKAEFTRKVDAPTWAEFKYTTADRFEYTKGTTEDGIPNMLIVNGEEWSVVRVDLFKDAEDMAIGATFRGTQAQTYCSRKTIAYTRANDTRILRVNMMHEVFHAGACIHGGDKWFDCSEPTQKYHPCIVHMSEFMTAFAHDNASFMSWYLQW